VDDRKNETQCVSDDTNRNIAVRCVCRGVAMSRGFMAGWARGAAKDHVGISDTEVIRGGPRHFGGPAMLRENAAQKLLCVSERGGRVHV
jgi:hypothetical protein